MDSQINITSFILDSFLMIFAYFFMATSFHSWGNFLSKLLKLNFSGHKTFFINIWLGFIFGLFFFSVIHLFLPINLFVSCIFYLPSSIYFLIKHNKKFITCLKGIGWLKLSAIALILIGTTVVSIQFPWHYDTGFYHLNSIRWANEQHIAKGIGNLHTRLGFNQIFFLYTASLSFHPILTKCAFHAANSFLFFTFGLGSIVSGTLADLILLSLFFFIPMPYYWIATPTPDLASTLIQIIAFRIFLEAFHFKVSDKGKGGLLCFVVILGTALLCIKLSNVLFAIGLALITYLFSKNYKFEKIEEKGFIRTLTFILLFIGIWLVRGYIQTGHPLFPSSIGRIEFDWTVPKDIAKLSENAVYAGSRTCERSFDINSPLLKNWNWLDYWFKYYFYNIDEYREKDFVTKVFMTLLLLFFPFFVFRWETGSLSLLILAMPIFLLWCYKVYNKKELIVKSKIFLYLLSVEIASLCFWFFMAPVPRFANATFVLLFVTVLFLLRTAYPKPAISEKIKKALLFYPGIILLYSFNLGLSNQLFQINGIIETPKIEMRVYTTDSGLKVLTPAKGHLIWDSPILTTPEPRRSLALRTDRVEDGFCIK